VTQSRRLPAEWETQSGVMLTWPHRNSDWAPLLDAAETVYQHIAAAINRFESLLIVCLDEPHQQQIHNSLRPHLTHAERVYFIQQPSNDSWSRDHGPLTVIEQGKFRLLDFQFNGWGNKYPFQLDNAISAALHRQQAFGDIPLQQPDWVLEGGSIDSDGQGTLLSTEACLLNTNRNGGMAKAEIETRLQRDLGAERVLWLKHGWLAGDDTDSHIDMLARFCDPHTVAFSRCADPHDVHYQPLAQMHEELQALRDAQGAAYKLVSLPIPDAIYDSAGERLPASYANFLIINGAVLVPQYQDEMDEVALARLRPCFLQRELIGIDCRTLIQQHGSLHCITMQLPQGVLPST